MTAANGGQPVGAYVNCNNFHGRLYQPLGRQIIDSDIGQQHAQVSLGGGIGSGIGGFDWFEAGRLHSGDILWTEDWFGDDYASGWSFLANRLRCGARLGPADAAEIEFGGSLVPRAGTDGKKVHSPGSLVGTPGLLMRALALVGNGAKHLGWQVTRCCVAACGCVCVRTGAVPTLCTGFSVTTTHTHTPQAH